MDELYHRQVLKASHFSSSTYNILVKTTYVQLLTTTENRRI